MSESMIFRGGMPYGPDVNKLKEAFPVPSLTEGLIITHEQIESAIGYKRGTSRFYGVVRSWVSANKNEFGIIMVWRETEGVAVLKPDEILYHGEKRTRQKVRQLGGAIKIFAWVPRDRLDGVGQQRLDKAMEVASKMKFDLSEGTRKMANELAPVKSLPKPKLIKAS